MYSKLDRLEKNELKLPVNAGSCVKLANYLNKESDDNKQYFSQHEDHVSLSKVIEKIDNNKKDIKKESGEILLIIIQSFAKRNCSFGVSDYREKSNGSGRVNK